MTDAGPLDLIDDVDSDAEEGQNRNNIGLNLPGTAANAGRPIARTRSLQISPTGRSWVAATTEGVVVYSMDDNLIFDPTDLDMDVTPEVTKCGYIFSHCNRGLIFDVLSYNQDMCGAMFPVMFYLYACNYWDLRVSFQCSL
jgi:periodic tryptophan protein 2